MLYITVALGFCVWDVWMDIVHLPKTIMVDGYKIVYLLRMHNKINLYK